MLSIEKAIGLYTDKINSNEKVDLTYFKEQLSAVDYTEFLDLIKFVKLGKSVKLTNDFDKKFEELDRYKNECHPEDLKQVSGFRTEKGDCDKESEDKLDEIFKEEFGDDK